MYFVRGIRQYRQYSLVRANIVLESVSLRRLPRPEVRADQRHEDSERAEGQLGT